MILQREDPIKIVKEQEIGCQISKYVAADNSFCFNAGAGAGKTYTLVNTLRGIILSNKLRSSTQQVLCITYTNVAKKEIEDRIGDNKQIVITTIHEFLWGFLKPQQPALITCHKRKIEETILELEAKLNDDKYFYNKLSEDTKNKFQQIIEREEFQTQYRKYYSAKAKLFRDNIKEYVGNLEQCSSILSNVKKFQTIVNYLRKLTELRETLDRINDEPKKIRVHYTSQNNRDNLARLTFSHETLLEYANIIFNELDKANILKTMFITHYPIVFIDEYQDTSKHVIKILSCIDQYANTSSYSFLVGYFGDTIQNIYSEGVGEELESIHTGLKSIDKIYNRRSTTEIIETINKIRNDQICQESIYEDNLGGEVQLVKIPSDDSFNIEEFIEKYYQQHKNEMCTVQDKTKQFGVLVLKHKTIVDILGFTSFYEKIKKMPRYGGVNFDRITTEFLGKDKQHMGSFFQSLKNLITLKKLLENPATPIKDINRIVVTNNIQHKLTFDGFMKLLSDLKFNFNSHTIESWLKELVCLSKKNKHIEQLLIQNFGLQLESTENQISFEHLRNVAYDFFKLSSEETNDSAMLEEFFDTNMLEVEKWYDYIARELREGINYLTYHSSKGLEFEHLLIIYDSEFSRDKVYFQRFLNDIEGNKKYNDKEKEKWKEARNLFYVVCSRATKNISILINEQDLACVHDGLDYLGFQSKDN